VPKLTDLDLEFSIKLITSEASQYLSDGSIVRLDSSMISSNVIASVCPPRKRSYKQSISSRKFYYLRHKNSIF
jgi:hypothetical protein